MATALRVALCTLLTICVVTAANCSQVSEPPDQETRSALAGLIKSIAEKDAKGAERDVKNLKERKASRLAAEALAEYLLSDHPNENKSVAMASLINLGPDGATALPALSRIMKDGSQSIEFRRLAALCAVMTIGAQGKEGVDALFDAIVLEYEPAADAAILALGRIDQADGAAKGRLQERALECTSFLIKALGDANRRGIIRTQAGYVLNNSTELEEELRKQVGQVIPVLIAAATQSAEPGLRSIACILVGKIGPEAKGALPTVVKALKDEDVAVRQSAAVALGSMREEGLPALWPLMKALNDSDDKVKSYAQSSLDSLNQGTGLRGVIADLDKCMRTGSLPLEQSTNQVKQLVAVRAAFPVLAESLESTDPKIRQRCARAYQQFGLDAKAEAPFLKEAIKREIEGQVKLTMVLAMIEIDPDHAKDLTPILEHDLQSDDLKTKVMAAAGLSKVRPESAGTEAVPFLIEGVKGMDLETRFFAMVALINIHAEEVKDVVPILRKYLKERNRPRESAVVLASIGSLAQEAIPELIDALSDKDPNLRLEVVTALDKINSRSEDVVPALARQGLTDRSVPVRRRAAVALGNFGPKGAGAVEALTRVVSLEHEPDSTVRSNAAYALVRIGLASRSALPVLHKALLTDPIANVRLNAIYAISQFGADAKEAIPGLTKALADDDSNVRQRATVALRSFGAQAQGAVSALAEAIRDRRNYFIRRDVAATLGQIGASARDAIPALIEMAEGDDATDRVYVANSLGLIGPDQRSIEVLLKMLDDKYAAPRDAAAFALGEMGAQAKNAVKPLSALLKTDKNPNVRQSAAYALGRIGPEAKEALPDLVKALGDSEASVRRRAATSLGLIDVLGEKVIPTLILVLADPDTSVRREAAVALGRGGEKSREALSILAKNLSYADDDVRIVSATALLDILVRLPTGEALTDLKSTRTAVQDQLKVESVPSVRKALENLRTALETAIQHGDEPSWLAKGGAWLRDNPRYSAPVAYVAVMLLIWGTILWWRPLWLFHLNEWLLQYQPDENFNKILGWLFTGLTVPPRYVTLLFLFHYRTRVLDAWVAVHLEAARENFQRLKDARQEEVRVPIRLAAGVVTAQSDTRRRIAEPDVNDFQEGFSGNLFRVILYGVGGAGKTSLACELGENAMEQNSARRLGSYPMLPVFIETLDPDSKPENRLRETVRQRLKELTGSALPPSPELTDHLLRQGRVLIILDGYSEMSKTTKEAVGLNSLNFLPAALIVTTRGIKELSNSAPGWASFELCLLDGENLSAFLWRFVQALGKKKVIAPRTQKKSAVISYASRLSEIAHERDLPVIFARRYLEQRLQGGATAKDPTSIPELVLDYVNTLNANIDSDSRKDNSTVQAFVKKLAWEYLDENFCPRLLARERAAAAISEEPLSYVRDRLRLVREIGPESKVAFTLDPIAEYLGALYKVESHGLDGKWDEFFAAVKVTLLSSPTVSDFLQVFQECCLYKEFDLKIPSSVLVRLSELTCQNLSRANTQNKFPPMRPIDWTQLLVDATSE